MKLRNFLYLDTRVIENYISAIDGYTCDEESREIATTNENVASAKGGMGFISGSGEHVGRKEEKIRKTVKINDASKFEKIYQFLENNEEGLKYYEMIDDQIYNDLRRDDFIEVLVTARFSKMKEITDAAKKIADFANVIETIADQEIMDAKTTRAINGFTALSKVKTGQKVSCVFEFEDNQYPMIAALNEPYFLCDRDGFVGQAYMLCKIIRKIPKGKSIRLDELFDDIKKIPMNRGQRRKMPKKIDNPEVLRDEIKGPALEVLPIAVYQ